jgi:hypothetical protein
MLFDTVPHSDPTQLLRFTDSPVAPSTDTTPPSHCQFFRLDSTPLRSGKRTHQLFERIKSTQMGLGML